MSPPDKFTISRPEYFLDCWLEEEESRQREYQRKQTKRRREEKIVVPAVVRKRKNEHGETKNLMVGHEVVLEPISLTPSLEDDSLEPLDVEVLPPVSHSVSMPKKGLPRPRRALVAPTALPSPSPTTVHAKVAPEFAVQPSPLHQQIISRLDRTDLNPHRPAKVAPESTVHDQASPLHQQIISGMGRAGLKRTQPTKMAPEPVAHVQSASQTDLTSRSSPTTEVSPERTKASARRSPISFHDKIKSGRGRAALKRVSQSDSQSKDNRVQQPTNPLWEKLKKMRKLMEGDEELQPPSSRERASSNNSDWSDSSVEDNITVGVTVSKRANKRKDCAPLGNDQTQLLTTAQ